MEKLEEKIAELGIKKRFARDAFLFLAGEEAQGFFYAVRGEVRVFQMNKAGDEVEIIRLRSGEFFGEAIAFAAEKFPAFARAVEETEVLYFKTDAMLKRIACDPAVARFFLSLLAKKCLALSARIETLTLRTVRQRLIQYLLSLCPEEGQCLIQLPIRKTELARLLGTISATLSRNLRKMEKEGLIEVKASKISVKDCSKLREALAR